MAPKRKAAPECVRFAAYAFTDSVGREDGRFGCLQNLRATPYSGSRTAIIKKFASHAKFWANAAERDQLAIGKRLPSFVKDGGDTAVRAQAHASIMLTLGV
jgi:hypothetical protein